MQRAAIGTIIPNPTMVPTDPTASFPIIATEMTFDTLPTSPVPETPVMAWNEITSADIVPTAPVAALPVVAVDRVTPTESIAPVAALPLRSIDPAGAKLRVNVPLAVAVLL